ncbi:MAG: hypothetical protein JSR15_02690 [Proteobacteria bacterium]|nr:hypothetical protein [Pseudomonadota bacterium]
MNTHRLLAALAAARNRPRRIAHTLQLPQYQRDLPLPLLERRVVAARLGGGARPVRPSRELFDDVQ